MILRIKNRPAGEDFRDFAVLVPETGLEPARREAYAPKAYVYTNFTTRAYRDYSIDKKKKRAFRLAFLTKLLF